MSILLVIPARKGSLRFPDKHHADLLGRPLFTYGLEAAATARSPTRVVVSSDDLGLESMARPFGIGFVERPAHLCTADAAFDDAVRHAWRTLKEREGLEAEIIVTMQGNVPVRREGQIDAVIERLESLPAASAVCTMYAVTVRPEWTKIIRDQEALSIEPYLPGHSGFRFQDYPTLYLLDGAVIAIRKETLFATEGKRTAHAWLGDNICGLIQEHPMYSLEVDFPDDLAQAAYYLLYKRFGSELSGKLAGLFRSS